MVLLRRALLTEARRAALHAAREPVVALQGSFRRGLRCAADADTIPTAAACATGARGWRFCGHAFLLRRAHSRPWSSSLASWRAAIAASSRSNSLFTTARSACIVFVAQTRSDGLSSLYRRRRRRAGDDLLSWLKNKRGRQGSRVFERKTVPTSVLRALASGLSAAAHSTLLAFQNAWPVMHRGSEVLGAVLGACGCALVVSARPTCVGRSAATARC